MDAALSKTETDSNIVATSLLVLHCIFTRRISLQVRKQIKIIIKINCLALTSVNKKSRLYGGTERIYCPCLELNPSPSITAATG
jgi:hypothetical protein